MSQPRPQSVPNTLKKRRSLDLLRQFTRTPSGSSTPKPPSIPPSPYSISRPNSRTSSHSTNASSQTPRSPLPKAQIPHSDPLPDDQAGLEALLNENTVQLQRLADRVESANEWIETDQILLARLLGDQERRREKSRISADLGGGASPSDLTPSPKSFSSASSELRKPVRFSALLSPHSPTTAHPYPNLNPEGEAPQAKEDSDSGQITELKERISTMKLWRKELERTVVWQREEGWRVMERMKGGTKRDERVERRGRGPEGWAVGGKTWEKGSGRVPSQGEWEGLFANC